MPIHLICLCGRGMSLPEKYAGHHVKCPKCRAVLRIPSAKENQALTRWFCKCGLRLKARTRTAGRKIHCPRCAAEVTVPFTDSHPSYVEDNFVLDEESGVVVEKKPELILEPEDPPTKRPAQTPPKANKAAIPEKPLAAVPAPTDEDTSAYSLEPAPEARPAAPVQTPEPTPNVATRKSKKSRPKSG